MKIGRPIKEIKARCKADGYEFENDEIDKILEYYEDYMFNKLANGEELKISGIGKINTQIGTIVSRLTSERKEYETVKFRFSPFKGIKSAAKERLSKVQKKHI